MIDYSPFWETMEKRGENWYTMTNKHSVSFSTMHKMKHNQSVNISTLDMFCDILKCDFNDIVKHIPEDK